MKDGDKEDYDLRTKHEVAYTKGTADRLLTALVDLDAGLSGCKISRLGHSLQSATRAWYDGADIDWVVEEHGDFQLAYYGTHAGADPNKRDPYAGHIYYDDCVKFCEFRDQTSFDPDYDTLPIEFFTNMTRQVFTRPPYDAAVTHTGVRVTLQTDAPNRS